jgi:two-component system, NarL family, invasion response regulator UvrY
MTRILLADDHAIVRKGLRETLEDELAEVTFGEAASGREVLECIRQADWDLLILDINMEGLSGLDVLDALRAQRHPVPVLILSMYPEREFALRALKQGAAGYLTKQAASDELVEAAKKVLAGGRYVGRALAEHLAAELSRGADALPHERLSTREFQILRMIAMAKTLKEIAAELALSEKTVGTYHARLLHKMGMRSDIQLTRYALRHDLVE